MTISKPRHYTLGISQQVHLRQRRLPGAPPRSLDSVRRALIYDTACHRRKNATQYVSR